MFSQSYLDNATDDELLSSIQTIANEIDGNLDDADYSHDYMNSLCLIADTLRDRLYDKLYADEKE
jgi:hypothetical protein